MIKVRLTQKLFRFLNKINFSLKAKFEFANNKILDIFKVDEPIYDVIALKKFMQKVNKKYLFQ